MATEVASLFASVKVDTRGAVSDLRSFDSVGQSVARNLDRNFAGAGAGLNDFGKRVDDSSGRVSRFGGVVTGFGAMAKAGLGLAAGGAIALGTAVVSLGPKLVSTAVGMESLANKSKIVFGDQLPMVQKWASEAAAGMGLTAREATGLAAGFADLLVPMGFTREEASKMSTDVIGLSGALAEWSGGTRSAAEVADILSAAMLGERDALQSLGISISQAEVDAKVLAMGLDTSTAAAKQQSEAIATSALIFEKSKDAQDSYAASGDDLASKQGKLKAAFNTVKETLIGAVVPALADGLTALTDFATGVGGFVSGGWTQFQEKLGDTSFLDTVREKFSAFGSFLSVELGPIFDQVKEVWSSAWLAIQGLISQAIEIITALWSRWGDDLIGFATRMWDNIKMVISGALTLLKGIFDTFAALFSGDWSAFWDGLGTIVSGVWTLIQGIARTGMELVRTAIALGLDALGALWNAAWNSLKTVFEAAWGHIVTFFQTVWTNIKSAAESGMATVRGAIEGGLNTIRGVWDNVWNGIVTFFGGVRDRVVGVANDIREKVASAIQGAVDRIKTVWNGIVAAFKGPIDAVRNILNPFIRALNKISGALNLGLELQEFHQGGVVGRDGRSRNIFAKPLTRDEHLIVAQTGERVIRRGQSMGGAGGAAADWVKSTMGRGDIYMPVTIQGRGIGDGIGDAICEAASKIPFSSSLAGMVDDLATKLLTPIRDFGERHSGMPGVGDRMVGNAAIKIYNKAKEVVEQIKQCLVPPAPPGGAGMGWEAMWNAVHGAFPNISLISAYRPGAVTRSGSTSYHALGRAIDISPYMPAFDWIANNYAATELIFTPAGARQEWHGRSHIYSGGVASDHYDHIHWAMQKGGIVTSPTYALIGESGPEAVIPLGHGMELAAPKIFRFGGREYALPFAAAGGRAEYAGNGGGPTIEARAGGARAGIGPGGAYASYDDTGAGAGFGSAEVDAGGNTFFVSVNLGGEDFWGQVAARVERKDRMRDRRMAMRLEAM